MTIETQISLNMTNNQAPVVVDAVQNEQMTRVISATLYDGVQPWSVSGGIKAGIAFRKPDGTSGLYDQLPDKKAAVTVSGNTVKATLAPQVQTVAGDVAAAIVFTEPDTLHRLATFPFILRVAKDPSAGVESSNDYYQYSTMEEVNAAIKDVQGTANAATEAVKGLQQAVAPAIPLTLTGTAVSTDMVSPVEHEVECRVYTNMIPYPYTAKPEFKGVTWTDNKDGSISCSGKATGYTDFSFIRTTVGSIKPGRYKLVGINNTIKGAHFICNSDYKIYREGDIIDTTNPSEYTAPFVVAVYASEGETVSGSVFPMLVDADVNPKEWVPYIPKVDGITITQQPGGATAITNSDGIASGFNSISPEMSFSSDNPGATIAATYNADTKKYIDSKFAELQAAIISTGGNV